MDSYHDDQLFDILSARVKRGLEQAVVTDEQLYSIADAAAGDARLAIGILRTAASTADRENHDVITDSLLDDAADDARTELRQKDLESLTRHQRVVYDIIDDCGPAGPSEIYDHYVEQVEDPRTKRTVRNYLSKMGQYNLLTADGTSRDRQYRVVTDAMASPTS